MTEELVAAYRREMAAADATIAAARERKDRVRFTIVTALLDQDMTMREIADLLEIDGSYLGRWARDRGLATDPEILARATAESARLGGVAKGAAIRQRRVR